jgi:hypothetical protein
VFLPVENQFDLVKQGGEAECRETEKNSEYPLIRGHVSQESFKNENQL